MLPDRAFASLNVSYNDQATVNFVSDVIGSTFKIVTWMGVSISEAGVLKKKIITYCLTLINILLPEAITHIRSTSRKACASSSSL